MRATANEQCSGKVTGAGLGAGPSGMAFTNMTACKVRRAASKNFILFCEWVENC
jgi:hypothetical protein